MHGWRGAHAWCVRVERALHACARVQGAGQRVRAWQWRGRGVGECRCSTCLESGNRDIGKSGKRVACIGIGNRSKSRRRSGFLRAGVVLVGRRCYTLAGLPLSLTRSPVLPSQRSGALPAFGTGHRHLQAVVGVEPGSNFWIGFAAMQTRATHPKTARREEKSDKKKEERIGAQLMAEITEPTDDTALTRTERPRRSLNTLSKS